MILSQNVLKNFLVMLIPYKGNVVNEEGLDKDVVCGFKVWKIIPSLVELDDFLFPSLGRFMSLLRIHGGQGWKKRFEFRAHVVSNCCMKFVRTCERFLTGFAMVLIYQWSVYFIVLHENLISKYSIASFVFLLSPCLLPSFTICLL